MNPSKKHLAILGSAFIFLGGVVNTQANTFQGSSPIWDSGLSWNTGSVPDLDDDIVFDGSGSSFNVFLTSGVALGDSITLSGADYSLNFTGASLLIDGAETNGASIYVDGSNNQLFRQVNLFLVDILTPNRLQTAGSGNLTFDSTTSIDSTAGLVFQADDTNSEIRVQGSVTTGSTTSDAVRVVGAGTTIFESEVNQNITLGEGGNGGNLVINNSSALTYDSEFSSDGTGSSSITKTGSGRFTVTSANTYDDSLTVDAGVFAIGDGGTTGAWASSIENNADLIFNRANDYTFSQAITGSNGRIIKQGGGDTTLSGAITADGGIDVENGNLILEGSSLNAGGLSIDLGAGLRADADLLDSTTISNSGTLSISGDGNDGDNYAGDISGTGAVEILANSDVTFTGTNTYTGATLLGNLATLNVDPDNVNGNVAVNSGATINFNAGGTYDGQVTGSGNLEKSGSGTLGLTNSNTYSGQTTISAGTLEAEANNTFSGTSNISLTGGTLDFSSFTNSVQSIDAAPGTAITSSGAVVNVSGGITFTGSAELSGFGTFDANFDSVNPSDGAVRATGGTLTLGSATRSNTMNSYTGSLDVGSQRVNILTSDTNATVAADVTLAGGTLASNRDLSVTSDGSIVGNGTIENRTIVDGGTIIDGNTSPGIEFAAGLTGDADLQGTVVVADTYRPFDVASSGPITVGNLDVSGATIVLDLSSSTLPRGAWSPSPTFSGLAALFDNTGIVDLTDTSIVFTASTLEGTYKLFSDNSNVIGNLDSVTVPSDGRPWTFDEVNYTLAVPEPSAFALILGLLAVGLTFRRRPRH